EGPQVLAATAAAAQDQHVMDQSLALMQSIKETHRAGDLLGRAVSLHACRTDANLAVWPAPRQDFQHVPDSGAGRARHQCDAVREPRQRLLAARIEVTQLGEFFFELPQGQLARAKTLGLHFLDQQLILAARRIDAQSAADNDFESIVRLEANPDSAAAVDD